MYYYNHELKFYHRHNIVKVAVDPRSYHAMSHLYFLGIQTEPKPRR